MRKVRKDERIPSVSKRVQRRYIIAYIIAHIRTFIFPRYARTNAYG
jgi:hypothetical protein